MWNEFSRPLRDTVIRRSTGHGWRTAYATAQGHRLSHEDRAVLDFNGKCFVGVFDGHCGSEVAQECVDKLAQLLCAPGVRDDDAKIRATVLAFDEGLRARHVQSGSTCTCAILDRVPTNIDDGSEINVTIVHVGDSRATLYRNEHVMCQTRDHKPDDPEETERIVRAGGHVTHIGGIARTNGNISMSRALGDFDMKTPTNCPMTADPSVYRWRMRRGDVLLLASDGLYEPESNKVIPFPMDIGRDDLGVACMDIVQHALDCKSHDNVTVAMVTIMSELWIDFVPNELVTFAPSLSNALWKLDSFNIITAEREFAKLHSF